LIFLVSDLIIHSTLGNLSIGKHEEEERTFAGELDSIERMLMQTEFTVIAGDHESYRISKQICPLLYICGCEGAGETNTTWGASIG
jgi:hypothetical protein